MESSKWKGNKPSSWQIRLFSLDLLEMELPEVVLDRLSVKRVGISRERSRKGSFLKDSKPHVKQFTSFCKLPPNNVVITVEIIFSSTSAKRREREMRRPRPRECVWYCQRCSTRRVESEYVKPTCIIRDHVITRRHAQYVHLNCNRREEGNLY